MNEKNRIKLLYSIFFIKLAKMKITNKLALKQLKADFLGKDAHSGITLTYAWLANQFGHIALGFIPAFLLYSLFGFNEIRAALYISIAWFLFESFNYLSSLLSKKESQSKVVFIPKKKKVIFTPKWLNVAFDTFTDVCFFALGAFLFALVIAVNNKITLIVLGALSIYLFFASKYWFITKMYQFYARYPFQFRLSQWDFTINTKQKEKVNQFLESKPASGNHLIITGDLSTGKTCLGVGMLNELSIKHNSCLFVPAMKLFNYFFKDEDDILESHEIWNWKTADFIMIDDINPSKPIQNELVTPSLLLSFIDTFLTINKKNRDLLKNKNILWILGSELTKPELNEWINTLNTIGVPNNKISVIDL